MVSLSWLRRKNIEEEIPQKASYPANVCGKRCSALQRRMQCTARTDAVHCGSGCSALRLRWDKEAAKLQVLFWMGKWKEMMLLYDEFHLHSLKSSGTQILLTVVQEKALCRIE